MARGENMVHGCVLRRRCSCGCQIREHSSLYLSPVPVNKNWGDRIQNRTLNVTDQTSSTGFEPNYIELAADIVSAFVSNNSVPAADLPALIANVHGALQNVSAPVPQ